MKQPRFGISDQVIIDFSQVAAMDLNEGELLVIFKSAQSVTFKGHGWVVVFDTFKEWAKREDLQK
jgi:hypothetical protein